MAYDLHQTCSQNRYVNTWDEDGECGGGDYDGAWDKVIVMPVFYECYDDGYDGVDDCNDE